MITAGIDAGLKSIKAVIIKDDKIIAAGSTPANGFDRDKATDELWTKLLGEAGCQASDIDMIVATGTGKLSVGCTDNYIVEPVADMAAARFLDPDVRTVIDAGAEQTRVVIYDDNGKVVTYTLNQMCGAGLGFFAETMARRIGMTIDQLGSLIPGGEYPVNAECGTCAGLDINEMIHAGMKADEIGQVVNDAIAAKVNATAMLTHVQQPVMLAGGMACNEGFVTGLKKRMDMDIRVADDPEMVCAIGAALVAAAEAG